MKTKDDFLKTGSILDILENLPKQMNNETYRFLEKIQRD